MGNTYAYDWALLLFYRLLFRTENHYCVNGGVLLLTIDSDGLLLCLTLLLVGFDDAEVEN